MKFPPASKKYSIDKVALSGWNDFDDPKDIGDTESVDVLNMVYDNGIIYPRNGSLLYRDKPAGETQMPFEMLVATTSNGFDRMILLYGNHFYVDDSVNNQWINITQNITQSVGLYYGYVNWNNGIGDDRLYFGNGTDTTLEWIQAMNQLSVAASSGDTTLTINDSTSFPTEIFLGDPTITIASPTVITLTNHGLSVGDAIQFETTGTLPTGITAATTYYVLAAGFDANDFEIASTPGGTPINTSSTQSGTHSLFLVSIPIIVMNAGTAVNLKYLSITGNVLNLYGTVGVNIPINSTVTIPIISKPGLPIGKVLRVTQNRLFLANYVQGENTIHFSYEGDPDNYTIDGSLATAGFITVQQGKGGIIGIDNFGEYFVVEKSNILIQYEFSPDSTGTTLVITNTPIINGDSIGPVAQETTLNYMNTLYYPTEVEGIISFSPETTGSQTSSGLQILSEKIQPYVTDTISFQYSRTAGWNQKLFWLTTIPFLGNPTGVNDGVLMHDLIRGSWTKFNNWNPADIKPSNNNLYYLSTNDGAVYQTFVANSFQDAVEANPFAYTASFTTKRFNRGNMQDATPADAMKVPYLYIQGLVTQNTSFYVSTYYNENGSLGSQIYQIDGSNTKIVQQSVTGGLGLFPFALPAFGGVTLSQMKTMGNPLPFAVYLELSQAFNMRNLQVKCFSSEVGAAWGVSNLTIVYLPVDSLNVGLVLGPTDTPPISL